MTHLLQSRVGMLDWSDDLRIRACREEFWLNYPRAVSIIDHIREMIDLPPRTAARCLGIIGESGLGKTTLCNRLLSQINQPNAEKILYLDLSKHGNKLDLFKLVHSVIGVTIPPRARGTVEEVAMFRARVEEIGLKAIILDEAQALDRTTLVRLAMSNLTTIRGLANGGVCVIALGLESLNNILDDKELDGRFNIIELERWGHKSATLSKFLKACVGYFPLKEQSFLDTATMQMLLVGEYGVPLRQLMELLQDCAVYAIRHGVECITEDVVIAVKDFG